MKYDFKIGVMADSFRLPFAEALKKSREVGATGIQLYVTSGENDYRTFDEERVKTVRALLSENGLEVSAVCGDLGGHGIMDREDNKWKIPAMKKIVDITKALGSSVVTTHIGTIPKDKSEERYSVMLEAAKELGAYAAANGVTFAIETGPETPDVLHSFILDAGEGIGVNLDPANFKMVTDVEAADAVKILGKYIVHTHAKDGVMLKKTDPRIIYDFFAYGGIEDMRIWEYFAELPLGEGGVNWDAYLSELDKIGYKGYLTIERECGDDPESDIKKAVSFLNSKIN